MLDQETYKSSGIHTLHFLNGRQVPLLSIQAHLLIKTKKCDYSNFEREDNWKQNSPIHRV